MHNETYFLTEGNSIEAIQAGDKNGKSVIIILHGLECSKEVQIPEITRLCDEGFFALTIDAPHHGSRYDGLIDLMQGKPRREGYQLMLSTIFQEAQEVSMLVKHFKEAGKKVCVGGISMGGYATYALMRMPDKPDLFAPFLANPDFRAGKYSDFPPSLAELSGPADFIENIYPASIFMFNGGSDKVVDPAGARDFYKKLIPFYKNCPEKLEYYEYPESDHLMKPEDWFDGWGKFIDRLRREGF